MEKETKTKSEPESKKDSVTGNKLLVIKIRNTTKATEAVRDTLQMMRLPKKFACSVFDDTPVIRGMIKKVKDYVTYGEVESATVKLLEDKRGKKDSEGKLKNSFALHPPRGGFERKGIKRTFYQGGALGNRGIRIKELLERML